MRWKRKKRSIFVLRCSHIHLGSSSLPPDTLSSQAVCCQDLIYIGSLHCSINFVKSSFFLFSYLYFGITFIQISFRRNSLEKSCFGVAASSNPLRHILGQTAEELIHCELLHSWWNVSSECAFILSTVYSSPFVNCLKAILIMTILQVQLYKLIV